MTDPILAPSSTIGILGGGQLGRMIAQAAASLGYRTHIYAPENDPPAAQVASKTTTAAYEDRDALARFAADCDVVTYEFENIPVEPVSFLAELLPVRPNPRVLRITQDRLNEKDFLARIGVPTTRYRGVSAFDRMAEVVAEVGRPSVLKSSRMGYDGKGQAKILEDSDLATAWRQMGASVGIVEKFVDFAYEASVIVARGLDGGMSCYVPVQNRHENHILAETIVPAPLPADGAAKAQDLARKIAEAIDLIGILCVELFVTADGDLLVNELAPRPHNSGHWTLDACVTSQFEQLVRAICGLPLGSTERLTDCVMQNLIGDQVHQWRAILADPRAKLHLYGKAEARPGRKMGHVTRLLGN
ncbi:5-(carboxyamino)imidazole ribonucleotide synthase [Elstera cyanobacteriorum]|uniref:5-(carboxyamino)imidazole ribonucleotide synthase n=1 Tax=Elstera cyanobacteriorum TaxID=2022747 RepID=UPI0023567E03|nr:5-(carboxyamino)imidazole ribonucleotide synthase [Elstera cyanobacteriorum]MCK6443986.1 5-(carboxyamino)imidazole ribonucleotide synthase [Elstera cyanobacteriorum]